MLRQPKTVRSRRLRTLGRAACHKLLGRLLFRCGRLGEARRQFERVLNLRGDDFQSYVHLGRIAYKLGDYAGWRRECGHARRTAPERFARLRHPFELFEGRSDWEMRPESGTTDTGSESAKALIRTADRTRTEPSEWAREVRDASSAAQDVAEAAGTESLGRSTRCVDDFGSAQERGFFRSRGPIGIDELRSADLDELARRLSE